MKWVLLSCIFLSLPLGGCVSSGGPWERDRYFEQAASIRELYHETIVPMVPDINGASPGTAFFIDDAVGYLTARHVLMHAAPRAVVGGRVGEISVAHQADVSRFLNDWVVFRMDAASTPARGLRYDPLSRIAPGDVVYMAGYLQDNYSESQIDKKALRELPLEIIPVRVADLRLKGFESADHFQDYILLEDPSESGRDYGGFSGGPVIVRDADTGQWKAVGLLVTTASDGQDQSILAIRPRIP